MIVWKRNFSMSTGHLIVLNTSPLSKESYTPKSLGDEFYLCQNGNMAFHWADFHETCLWMKDHIATGGELSEDFKKREIGIERLKLIPIWIKSNNKVNQLTIFDLYENYILNKTHLIHQIDPLSPVEISFISGTGPFKSMAIAECFSHITYKDFIMIYLLKDKLPRRDFRIRLKAKVLAEYGENFSQARLVNLEQLTSRGILLSLDWGIFMEELSQTENFRILIETNSLKESIGKNLSELKSHLSLHTFNLLYSSKKEDAIELKLNQISSQSSFEFLKNRKIYLYVSYDDMSKSSVEKTKNIETFVSYSKKLVKDHILSFTEQKQSA